MRTPGFVVMMSLLLLALAAPTAAQEQQGGSYGELDFAGTTRSYFLYVPSTYPPTSEDGSVSAAPLLIVLHGGGGTGQGMVTLTRGGFNQLAERDGFIVVYPNAVDKQWNDGRDIPGSTAHRDNIDDVGFISRLIDHLGESYSIDYSRVYATGISNGGIMSYRLACELGDRIAGIAAVAASMPTFYTELCLPFRPLPVLVINGTDDPLVPYDGGEIRIGRLSRDEVLSTDDTINFWLTANQCFTEPFSTIVYDDRPLDNTRARYVRYEGCADGVLVELYAIEGGGHTFPGGRQYLPPGVIGRTSREIDAAEVIWNFLSSFVAF